MNGRFATIVVPLDLEGHSDRSIDVARSLAALGNVRIELVTVLPEQYTAQSGLSALEQRGLDHRLRNWTPVVLLGNDIATVIADHLAQLDAPLLVMATSAHGVFGDFFSGSPTARLLSLVASPVLVVGPHVPEPWSATAPTLVACVGPASHSDPAIGVMACWTHTFGGRPPWFLEVLRTEDVRASGGDVSESALVMRRADRLAELGVTSEWEVLHGDDPVEAIESFADGMIEPVLMVNSERWNDPSRLHLHSVARRLAHHARQPVLVLPHADQHEVVGASMRAHR
jgi:nucleotide-binding universal stress UspA family protein